MLTIQFVPYTEIQGLNSVKRINKLLKIVKEEKIILLEGRLKSHEEAELISRTMEEIDNKFKGIEISVVNPENSETKDVLQAIRQIFLNLVLGSRQGFTIIGPASIVKEIKQDPGRIQLLTQESKR
ncbi:MAG: DUF2073 domain-containing protein [Nanoarchaeota archaeon]|nr:DUF2073 domain-containing protein [Nanoarchaeota archaeon]MBU1269094.1 DUF2073 domain-containing protein [Nanoarchaeota archaeon]MBU1604498.1 DUF2073 domain-containing protein [Nanoarchaeota archaeon]MBU2442994.1 DUF2073 domain-containing protein [Nanoarchaeota archaeon]